MAGPRRSSPYSPRSEHGFTIIEVMVAAAILLTGVLGVLGVVVQADGVTYSNRAREQGVALQREVIEAAQSIPYDQLTQTSIVSRVQAKPGLSDSTMTATGWTVRRRNITFTIAVGVCSVDDANDQTGPHESAGYCRSGTGATTAAQCATYLGRTGSIAGAGIASAGSVAIGDCGIDLNYDGAVDGLVDTSGGPCSNCSGTDTNPNDYKRIVVDVRWNRGVGTRYALQSTTVANPGLSAAPAVTSLDQTSGSQPVLHGDPPIGFLAQLNAVPAAVAWYVDGTAQGAATGSGINNWTFSWDLGTVSDPPSTTPNPGEVLDGTYLVSAKGFDTYGQAGTAKARTLVVNRRVPYPPTNFDAGRNDGNAYLEWDANAERDVEAYHVYRRGASSDQLVCSISPTQTRCVDTGMPSGQVLYYVRAVDRDAGNQREGQLTPDFSIPAVDTAPPPPANLIASPSPPNTVLKWDASTDPDAGDSILYYRIYRDGTDFVSNLYDRTSTSSQLSYTDSGTGGDPHTYWVVAVDSHLMESRPLGIGVTK
jgi:prepilin-type N-terminal cleavage/methylation domain-containing protein